MDLVWDLGEASVRDIYLRLLKKRAIAYTTVMTIMGNLAEKGALKRRQQGRAYIYAPTVSKDDFARASVTEIVDKMVGHFTEPAMSYLVDHMERIAPQKLKELEEVISNLRKSRKEPSG